MGDQIMSYFKFERKSNYKSGIYDSLGLFENRFNFLAFYRVFIYEGSFVNHSLANKNTIEAAVLQSFISQSEKEHG